MNDTTADEDGEPLDVAGPFSIPIDAARHYEWSRETGWMVCGICGAPSGPCLKPNPWGECPVNINLAKIR